MSTSLPVQVLTALGEGSGPGKEKKNPLPPALYMKWANSFYNSYYYWWENIKRF